MLMSSQFAIESEIEWLCYQLWSKNTARAPTFSFQLADTVIMRQGSPQTWYFSSKEGYILKKNYQNVRLSKISKGFIKRQKYQKVEQTVLDREQMLAATTYQYRLQRNAESLQERTALLIGYVTGSDLLNYLRASISNRIEDGRPNIIQAFVPTMQARNHVFRLQWSPSHMEIIKITNKLDINDPSHLVQTRAVTAEAPNESLCEHARLPNQGKLYERLLQAMVDLSSHVKKNSDIQLTGGTFYFKFDVKDRLFLLFATQIRTNRSIPILSSPKTVFVLQSGANNIIGQPNVDIASAKKTATVTATEKKSHMRLMESVSHENLKKDDSEVVICSSPRQASARLHKAADNRKLTAATTSAAQKANAFCVFCAETLSQQSGSQELTVNQIIKLYEYFEENHASLLLIPAHSERQQAFYKTVHAEISQHAATSTSGDSVLIPAPLQMAFNLQQVSGQRFNALKSDASFIYLRLKTCQECHAAVRAMFLFQSKEQVKLSQASNSAFGGMSMPAQSYYQDQNLSLTAASMQGTNPRRFVPLNQGWMAATSDQISREAVNKRFVAAPPSECITDLDSADIHSINQNAQFNQKRQSANLNKLQAGRDFQIDRATPKMLVTMDNHQFENPDDVYKMAQSAQKVQKVVSLNVVSANVRQATNTQIDQSQLSSHQKKTNQFNNARKSVKSETIEMNENIIKFVQDNKISQPGADELQQSSQQRQIQQQLRAQQIKANVRDRVGGIQSKNSRIANPLFNFNEKRQLRNARRSLKKQNEHQLKAQMFNEHRVLMNSHRLDPYVDTIKNMAYHQQQVKQSSTMKNENHYLKLGQSSKFLPESQVSNRGSRLAKIRPISAKPNIGHANQPKLVNMGSTNDLGSLNHNPSLQGMSNEDFLRKTSKQRAGFFRFPGSLTNQQPSISAVDALSGSQSNLNERQDSTATQMMFQPSLYSKHDAIRIYLNPLHKNSQMEPRLRGQQTYGPILNNKFIRQDKQRKGNITMQARAVTSAWQRPSQLTIDQVLKSQQQKSQFSPKSQLSPHSKTTKTSLQHKSQNKSKRVITKQKLQLNTDNNQQQQQQLQGSRKLQQQQTQSVSNKLERNNQHLSPQKQPQIERQSLDMFDNQYQTGASSSFAVQNASANRYQSVVEPTNIVVPQQTVSSDLLEQASPTEALIRQVQSQTVLPAATSADANNLQLPKNFISLQGIQMHDIDQIAANADNLIEILQKIKHQKLQQTTKITPNFAPSATAAASVKIPNDDAGIQDKQRREITPQNEQPKPVDFWDSHTHSPPKNPVNARQEDAGTEQSARDENRRSELEPYQEHSSQHRSQDYAQQQEQQASQVLQQSSHEYQQQQQQQDDEDLWNTSGQAYETSMMQFEQELAAAGEQSLQEELTRSKQDRSKGFDQGGNYDSESPYPIQYTEKDGAQSAMQVRSDTRGRVESRIIAASQKSSLVQAQTSFANQDLIIDAVMASDLNAIEASIKKHPSKSDKYLRDSIDKELQQEQEKPMRQSQPMIAKLNLREENVKASVESALVSQVTRKIQTQNHIHMQKGIDHVEHDFVERQSSDDSIPDIEYRRESERGTIGKQKTRKTRKATAEFGQQSSSRATPITESCPEDAYADKLNDSAGAAAGDDEDENSSKMQSVSESIPHNLIDQIDEIIQRKVEEGIRLTAEQLHQHQQSEQQQQQMQLYGTEQPVLCVFPENYAVAANEADGDDISQSYATSIKTFEQKRAESVAESHHASTDEVASQVEAEKSNQLAVQTVQHAFLAMMGQDLNKLSASAVVDDSYSQQFENTKNDASEEPPAAAAPETNSLAVDIVQHAFLAMMGQDLNKLSASAVVDDSYSQQFENTKNDASEEPPVAAMESNQSISLIEGPAQHLNDSSDFIGSTSQDVTMGVLGKTTYRTQGTEQDEDGGLQVIDQDRLEESEQDLIDIQAQEVVLVESEGPQLPAEGDDASQEVAQQDNEAESEEELERLSHEAPDFIDHESPSPQYKVSHLSFPRMTVDVQPRRIFKNVRVKLQPTEKVVDESFEVEHEAVKEADFKAGPADGLQSMPASASLTLPCDDEPLLQALVLKTPKEPSRFQIEGILSDIYAEAIDLHVDSQENLLQQSHAARADSQLSKPQDLSSDSTILVPPEAEKRFHEATVADTRVFMYVDDGKATETAKYRDAKLVSETNQDESQDSFIVPPPDSQLLVQITKQYNVRASQEVLEKQRVQIDTTAGWRQEEEWNRRPTSQLQKQTHPMSHPEEDSSNLDQGGHQEDDQKSTVKFKCPAEPDLEASQATDGTCQHEQLERDKSVNCDSAQMA